MGVGLTYSGTKSVQQVVAVSIPRLAEERSYFKFRKLGASPCLSPAEEPQLGWEQLEPGHREVCLPRVLLIKQSLHGCSPPEQWITVGVGLREENITPGVALMPTS